jgi:5'-nucleotidase
MPDPKLILLTNDDGIHSPGIWAAASALASLGTLVVAAPARQCSAAGRSMPSGYSGRIEPVSVAAHGRDWAGYSVDGSPAQVVIHAHFDLLPRQPDLVVSGINYGENVGSGVTISGTIGAALEGASLGAPSLAVSLETEMHQHYSNSSDVDFSAAAHFTGKFARMLLALERPVDLDLLKVEVPAGATADTPWRVTRLSRHRYFFPLPPRRDQSRDSGSIGYYRKADPGEVEPDSDVRALLDGVVSVTPLSLDLTSRLDFSALLRALQSTETC